VTLTFLDSTDPGTTSLADGNYRLTIHADRVTNSTGQPLDGDGNGLPGGDDVVSFFRLYGDVNGDRTVNGLDLSAFRAGFGTAVGGAGYLDYLDFDGDGAINGLDLAQFRSRFGMTLAP
jgi:hypothetical protein